MNDSLITEHTTVGNTTATTVEPKVMPFLDIIYCPEEAIEDFKKAATHLLRVAVAYGSDRTVYMAFGKKTLKATATTTEEELLDQLNNWLKLSETELEKRDLILDCAEALAKFETLQKEGHPLISNKLNSEHIIDKLHEWSQEFDKTIMRIRRNMRELRAVPVLRVYDLQGSEE